MRCGIAEGESRSGSMHIPYVLRIWGVEPLMVSNTFLEACVLSWKTRKDQNNEGVVGIPQKGTGVNKSPSYIGNIMNNLVLINVGNEWAGEIGRVRL